jgi:hypothetical protein
MSVVLLKIEFEVRYGVLLAFVDQEVENRKRKALKAWTRTELV